MRSPATTESRSNRSLGAALLQILLGLVLAAALILVMLVMPAEATTEITLQNYNGNPGVACPCFVSREQAGVVLTAPPGDYPIEILRVGVYWGSMFGGTGVKLHQAIKIYDAGLPDPGVHIFELLGPQLTDGVINEFDLEPLPGEIIINQGAFTVALEFLDANANDIFAPSVVHDGNGCQWGMNVVFAVPGGWSDACALGVTGDWGFYAVYRSATLVGAGENVISSVPALLRTPSPNPFESHTTVDFILAEAGRAKVNVYDVKGRRVANLANQPFGSGSHTLSWDGRNNNGERLPSGMYFIELQAAGERSVQKVLLTR